MHLLPPPQFFRFFGLIAIVVAFGFQASALERISVAANGDEIVEYCFVDDVTPDGRYVVISSVSPDLVLVDTNDASDIFLIDRSDGSVELISVDSDGDQHTTIGMNIGGASISNDGRYVAFESNSPDFVDGDTNGTHDIFVRDRQDETTTRVSLSHDGMELSGTSRGSISGNGQFIVFTCDSDDAVLGDANMGTDVFRRDMVNGNTIRVSISDDEMEAIYPFGDSFSPSISDDGNRIGFLSNAENLVLDDDNGYSDMFVRDVAAGTTTRVSLTSTGAQQEMGGCAEVGVISANGLTVAFGSSAKNLLPGDNNNLTDVFVREIAVNNLEVVSVATNSSAFITDGFTSFPTISPDGRHVGFWSTSTQLDPRHQGTSHHGYIRDRQTKQTVTVNISTTGQFANNASSFDSNSEVPLFANDGVYVFSSTSDELVPGDDDEAGDVYQSTFIPAAAGPDNSALCAKLKKKLKKLKKKLKKAKRTKKVAQVKRFKKKIKKSKQQIAAL